MKISHEMMFNRIKDAYHFHKDIDLAHKLDKKKQTVSSWKKIGVPIEVALQCCEECQVSLDYLYFGTSSSDFMPGMQAGLSSQVMADNVSVMLKELSEAEQKVIFETTQQLRQFRVWRTEIEQQLAEIHTSSVQRIAELEQRLAALESKK